MTTTTSFFFANFHLVRVKNNNTHLRAIAVKSDWFVCDWRLFGIGGREKVEELEERSFLKVPDLKNHEETGSNSSVIRCSNHGSGEIRCSWSQRKNDSIPALPNRHLCQFLCIHRPYEANESIEHLLQAMHHQNHLQLGNLRCICIMVSALYFFVSQRIRITWIGIPEMSSTYRTGQMSSGVKLPAGASTTLEFAFSCVFRWTGSPSPTSHCPRLQEATKFLIFGSVEL